MNDTPSILTRHDGPAIAYHQYTGKNTTPGVVFMSGFMSDMTGAKALAVDAWCREHDQSFLRFDYRGHGQSAGKFVDGTIGKWAEDAVFAIDRLTSGPQVLVGSSMGGWIMLLAALRLKHRIAGLLGLAAAPDFTEDLIHTEMEDEHRAQLERDGFITVPTDYGEDPYIITKDLIEDGRSNMLLNKTIGLGIPVRLIQGLQDADVPWQTALRIQERLASDDVEVTLVKNGDHRLSEPEDLDRLRTTLERLIDRVSV